MNTVAAVHTPPARVAHARWHSHALYVALTAVLVATVVRGFWPSYFGRLWQGTFQAHWVMHLHGVIFTGWMALLVGQVALAATGRIRAHRRFGTVGFVYGPVLLVMGLIASFVAPTLHVRAGRWTVDQAAGFMLLPLVDMLLFGGFFAAAMFYRSRPEIHKRLIISATVAVSFAAVARMYPAQPIPLLILWLSPIAAAAAFDLITRKRVHGVWVISLAVFAIAFLRIFAMESSAWLRIGRALLAPVL